MKQAPHSLIVCACLAGSAALAEYSNIDYANRYACSANAGWIDAYAEGSGGTVVGETYCSGYLYSANLGWIHLGDGSPADGKAYANDAVDDFGVNHDGNGMLFGYAYGANIGWIQFAEEGRPEVNLSTGALSGYAWSANVGWISLSNAYAYVRTWYYGEIPDTDGDGLREDREIYELNTDPLDADSDDDALDDGKEVNDYGTDPRDPDTDNDGLTDGGEVMTHSTDPNNPDTDSDGLSDGYEVYSIGSSPLDFDTDNDGFDDGFEVSQGLYPTNSNAAILSYILNNPAVFDMYTPDQLGELATGDLLIQASNGYINLWLQLLKSDDFATWTNAGDAAEWSMPAGNKEFFKVRANP